MGLIFYFSLTVQQRRMPDRVGPAARGHHGRQADDQQRPGDHLAQAEGLVAQQEGEKLIQPPLGSLIPYKAKQLR